MMLDTIVLAVRRVEDFDLHKRLYQGKASLLYSATCKKSQIPVAVKVYRKARLSELNWYQVQNPESPLSAVATAVAVGCYARQIQFRRSDGTVSCMLLCSGCCVVSKTGVKLVASMQVRKRSLGVQAVWQCCLQITTGCMDCRCNCTFCAHQCPSFLHFSS